MSEFGFLTASAPNGGAIVPGVTPIIGGAVGQILFQGTGNVVQESANLFWNNTNGRLGIGTSSPTRALHVNGNTFIQTVSNSDDGLVISNQGNIAFAGTTDVIGARFRGLASAFQMSDAAYNVKFVFSMASNLSYFNGGGNVAIGTTTDAGFRLDVNGTARVQGVLTIGGEIFGATNTYFNGPSLNTGTLWLRFNAVNSNGNFTATGPVQGTNVIASGTNSQLSSTGSGVQGVLISNTATSTNWRIEGHRTTSGALEFKNDLTNPVLNLFSTRNVGIGTFTDAGFRLDVNGTARVSGLLTVGPSSGNFLQTGGSTATWFSDLNNPLRITLAQTLINLNNLGDFTIWRTMSSARGVVNTRPEEFNTAIEASYTVGGLILRNLNNINKSIFYASTKDGGSVQNAPLLRYFHAVKGNITGYTNYRGIEVEDLDSFFGTTSGSVGIGSNTSINGSAILDITSTTQGFLPPRMTQTQRNAIASPAIGLEIYQTDATEGKYIYKSSGWTYIG